MDQPAYPAEKLEVMHTLQRVGGAPRLVSPKTDDSSRTVPLPLPVCRRYGGIWLSSKVNEPRLGPTGKITDSCFLRGEVRRWP